jgi:hypothetical protein
MAFNHKFNSDDTFLRNVIVGLLDLLNKKVVINYVVSDDETKEVPIPFFYNMAGDQQFLEDFYAGSEDPDCYKTEGNADPIPRGTVDLESMKINSASLTNKFVRGSYVKNVKGEVKTFSSYLLQVPLQLTFKVQIICDNKIEAFKAVQQLIHVFYKANKFSVSFKGFRIACLAGFSEDYSVTKPTEFTVDTEQRPLVDFTIEVETYQPVIDDATERFRGNLMQAGIDTSISLDQNLTKNSSKIGEPDPAAPYGRDENGNPIKPGPSLA